MLLNRGRFDGKKEVREGGKGKIEKQGCLLERDIKIKLKIDKKN